MSDLSEKKETKEIETDLFQNKLVRAEEIKLIYEGPSFEGQMEISKLTSQLKSTEFVIREIVSEIYRQKGFKKPEDTKIYLKLKKGSFQEIISVLFNNPTTANIIGGCVVALFTYFLTKNKNNGTCKMNISNLINNYGLAKNINQIVLPLEEKKDRIRIISSRPDINTSISLQEKKVMYNVLKELKKKIAIEIYKEEFFGYLSVVDLDREKYAFTLEGNDRPVLTIFDKKPNLNEIKEILGFRLKINARATYEEKILKKLEVETYEIKKRRNLNDFEVKRA